MGYTNYRSPILDSYEKSAPYGVEWINGQPVPKKAPPSGGASDLAALTPADRVTQSNTAADQAQRATIEANRLAMADADRKERAAAAAAATGLATTAEANRLSTSTADRNAQVLMAEQDRLAKAGLSQAEIAARMAELTTSARLTDENDAKKSARGDASRDAFMTRIPGLISSLTGDAASGGQAATTAGTDPTAANAATYRDAAGKVGQIGRASLASLQDESVARGGGLAPGGMESLMGTTGARLGDVGRQDTISGVDTANQMANRNYAGELTKRGQNLGVTQSILSLLGSRAY